MVVGESPFFGCEILFFWLRNPLVLVAESSFFGCGIGSFLVAESVLFWLRKRLFLVAEACLILVAESPKFGCGSVEIWFRNRTLFHQNCGWPKFPTVFRGQNKQIPVFVWSKMSKITAFSAGWQTSRACARHEPRPKPLGIRPHLPGINKNHWSLGSNFGQDSGHYIGTLWKNGVGIVRFK